MSRQKPFLTSSTLFWLLILFQCFNPNVSAQNDYTSHDQLQHMSETIVGWPLNTSTILEEEFDMEDGLEEEDGGGEGVDHRRSLLYYYYRSSRPRRYYISYGALSANRVLCPPRSGRSYYTHNCHNTGRPVNPYSRGRSSITRCRR